MHDDGLRRDLRAVDAPAAPRAEFREALYERLVEERARISARPTIRVRPNRVARRGSTLLVAALVVGGTVGGSVLVAGGPPRPSANDLAAPNAIAADVTSAPSGPPSAEPRVAAPRLAIAPQPSGLAALPGGGLVVHERRTIGGPTRLLQLTADGTSEFAPAVPGMQVAATWAPDGTSVMFAAVPVEAPDDWRIWRVDASGTSAELVSTDCRPPDCLGETEPSYSSDGRRLAFVRTAPGPAGQRGGSVLAIRDLETGRVSELRATAQPADRQILHPSFSPDGASIAFAVASRGAMYEDTASAIWRIEADGTALRRLTPDALVAGDPAWSPDGTEILFGTFPIRTIWAENQRGPEISFLHTMAPDGSDLRRLPLPDQVGGASWVDGGRAILYAAIVNAGTGSPGITWLMTVDRDATAVHAVSRGSGCCSWYAVQQPSP